MPEAGAVPTNIEAPTVEGTSVIEEVLTVVEVSVVDGAPISIFDDGAGGMGGPCMEFIERDFTNTDNNILHELSPLDSVDSGYGYLDTYHL
ncbi:hypothetical protein U1Q18_023756 [Sarracenia purpurea var. burkii]